MSRNSNGQKPRLEFEDAKIIFRNFRGEDYGKNPAHKKGFSVLLDTDLFNVEDMREDGWNVKQLKPREGYEDDITFHLPVEVRWDKFPPIIWLVTQTGINEDGRPKYKRTKLDEESSFMIDTAEIIRVDATITGNFWEVNGNTGLKAYLKEMYITLVQDRFDQLYDWDE